jgi:hypothetical protein
MGMRIREWELSPLTATFIAQTGGKTAGTISLVHSLPEYALPADELYHDELMELRSISHSVAEACNGATGESFRDMSITIEFFRCLIAHCWSFNIHYFVGVTNKNHKTFYEFLYMIQIGEEKSYSTDHYDPVVLMCLDCDFLRDYLSSQASDNGSADSFLRDYLLFQNPYLDLTGEWERKARRAFKRQRIRERFLNEMRNTLVASVFDIDNRKQINTDVART